MKGSEWEPTLRVQVSPSEGPESPRESPWVSLGSQNPYILKFPKSSGLCGTWLMGLSK